jgi:hypothetical protein
MKADDFLRSLNASEFEKAEVGLKNVAGMLAVFYQALLDAGMPPLVAMQLTRDFLILITSLSKPSS